MIPDSVSSVKTVGWIGVARKGMQAIDRSIDRSPLPANLFCFESISNPSLPRDDVRSFPFPRYTPKEQFSIFLFSIFLEKSSGKRKRERGSIWSGAKPINFPRQRRIKRPILLLGLGFERNLLETISRPVPRQAVFNFSSPFSKTDTILGDRTLGPSPSLPVG